MKYAHVPLDKLKDSYPTMSEIRILALKEKCSKAQLITRRNFSKLKLTSYS